MFGMILVSVKVVLALGAIVLSVMAVRELNSSGGEKTSKLFLMLSVLSLVASTEILSRVGGLATTDRLVIYFSLAAICTTTVVLSLSVLRKDNTQP